MVLTFTLSTFAHGRNVITMPHSSETETPTYVQKWFMNANNRQSEETLTEFHFFIQDQISGPNQTVFNVAEASVTPNSPYFFGRTQVVDHLMTAGPEFDSPQVGRIQGIHALDDLHETALTVNWNILFTEGPYEGSTLTLLGRLVAYATDGELSIVSGTGKFMLARGVALKKTYSTDAVTKNMVMEYRLYVSTPGA
ncbi:hypothetical protein ACJIZ3_022429 [Penstemon smallii]|uniref:Dirigent protein n=1 Tax=Penstemon smallii TaxID=265156 RepID=A0ABD3TNF1_9LAMI